MNLYFKLTNVNLALKMKKPNPKLGSINNLVIIKKLSLIIFLDLAIFI